MAPYTLTYFGIPALGEPIRILLHMGKFDWVDNKLPRADWAGFKGKTKWGQLPLLTTPDGKEMPQTKAIVRFLGAQIKYEQDTLYPGDLMLRFQVDEIIDAMEDLRLKLVATRRIQDPTEKETVCKQLYASDGEFHGLLTKIQNQVGDKHVVGGQFTLADVWFFFFLNFLRTGFFDHLPTDYLDHYPKLKSIVANAGAIPEIKEYYSKKDLVAEPAYEVFAQ
eukprot:TRINITY_DN110819_c0_g1_i1.p1 TRINITY_DN110819_c0_g1~~TRINITY_DN110819_c0_g1_i1.p1  ORF type:complete len:246 (+),score=39.66 TRINITY_DN110819_c0_g1_i1:74-739(+)